MSYPSGNDQWLDSYNPHLSYDQQQQQPSYPNMTPYDSFMATDTYTTSPPASYYPSNVTEITIPAATGAVITDSSSHIYNLDRSSSSSKQMKRRSRASKNTPTTVVKAQDPNNFRSLVQQLTGCPSGSSLMPPGSYRGPLSINFAQGEEEDANGGLEDYYGGNSSSTYIPFGSGDTDFSGQQQLQFQPQTHNEGYPSSYESSTTVFESSGNFAYGDSSSYDHYYG